MPSKILLFATCAFIPTAAAQTGGWSIETDSVVSPSNPTTNVEVWAWFDDPLSALALARGDFDFHAGDGEFSSPQVLLPWTGGATSPGGTPGTVIGNTVTDVLVEHFWGIAGLWPDPSNSSPVLVWSADWTTTDFTPRSVDLDTRNTTDYWIGLIQTGQVTQWYPQQFTHGTGAISVVPSPATALPLAMLGTLALRRRRTS